VSGGKKGRSLGRQTCIEGGKGPGQLKKSSLRERNDEECAPSLNFREGTFDSLSVHARSKPVFYNTQKRQELKEGESAKSGRRSRQRYVKKTKNISS